jgi:hypothetical protein
MDWGRPAALLCFLPALAAAAATALFLLSYVGNGVNDLSPFGVSAIVALSIWVTYNSYQGMKSGTSRAAVAVRKDLTAGREFLRSRLRQPNGALRDEWYPWLLALGLGKEADDWSARRVSTIGRATSGRRDLHHEASSSSGHGGSPSAEGWGGFGGGFSGGGGGGAAWSVAAAGLAAPIAAPSQSSSDSSSDSGSGGGSSGGGGGGGW